MKTMRGNQFSERGVEQTPRSVMVMVTEPY